MERRLGRGLGSLLGQTPESDATQSDQRRPSASTGSRLEIDVAARLVDVATVRRNPDQPRTTFDSAALEELRDSILRHGVLQPICVRRVGDGYEIVSGERRWRAARSAGLVKIPAVVREDVPDEVSLELAIVENVQRQDLDPLEKARGYQALMERVGLTQEQVAERVGIARASVTNHLRLLDLPSEAQEALAGGMISMGHAKALLGIKPKKAVLAALGKVVRGDLSVRATEALAKGTTEVARLRAAKVEPWVSEMEARLREALGVRVQVRNGKGYRGSIQLDYSDRNELERICDQLSPEEELG